MATNTPSPITLNVNSNNLMLNFVMLSIFLFVIFMNNSKRIFIKSTRYKIKAKLNMILRTLWTKFGVFI